MECIIDHAVRLGVQHGNPKELSLADPFLCRSHLLQMYGLLETSGHRPVRLDGETVNDVSNYTEGPFIKAFQTTPEYKNLPVFRKGDIIVPSVPNLNTHFLSILQGNSPTFKEHKLSKNIVDFFVLLGKEINKQHQKIKCNDEINIPVLEVAVSAYLDLCYGFQQEIPALIPTIFGSTKRSLVHLTKQKAERLAKIYETFKSVEYPNDLNGLNHKIVRLVTAMYLNVDKSTVTYAANCQHVKDVGLVALGDIFSEDPLILDKTVTKELYKMSKRQLKTDLDHIPKYIPFAQTDFVSRESELSNLSLVVANLEECID